MNLAILFLCLLFTATAFAERTELRDGTYMDEDGVIYDDKFENAYPMAPWNSPLYQEDPMAPWNSPVDGKEETNEYLRENDELDSDYFWE